ncbi:Endonuclease MutS2 [Candidatus Entotheonellaceae bacterium PAL068K]
MTRKKKRPQRQASGQPKRAEHFHAPFGELKALLRHTKGTPTAAPSPPSPASSPKPPEPPDTQAQREQALFLAEMAGVKPLPPDPRGRVETHRPSRKNARQAAGTPDALADLRDLVEGRGTFTIQYTDEYMEGVAPDVDLQLAQRLHRGDFAIQAHLDLHGSTVDEAKAAVDRFLRDAYASGRRCVRLVHGRGRNSRDNRPVLKEQVQFWLSRGRLSRLVLAFATAPTTDGGAGAAYVLLRHGPHASRRT